MGFFTDLISLPYNAVTGQQTSMQQATDLAAGQAEIQGVADNVAQYYADTVAQQKAQAAADAQKAALAGDLSKLNLESAASGCAGVNLSGVGLGCVSSVSDFLGGLNTAVRIGLAVVAVLMVGYIYVVFVAPFVNLRRR